tara:strand:- start:578 stop:4345 length:3768 start_codon:yes stop_codon:yes gene_type:complete
MSDLTRIIPSAAFLPNATDFTSNIIFPGPVPQAISIEFENNINEHFKDMNNNVSVTEIDYHSFFDNLVSRTILAIEYNELFELYNKVQNEKKNIPNYDVELYRYIFDEKSELEVQYEDPDISRIVALKATIAESIKNNFPDISYYFKRPMTYLEHLYDQRSYKGKVEHTVLKTLKKKRTRFQKDKHREKYYEYKDKRQSLITGTSTSTSVKDAKDIKATWDHINENKIEDYTTKLHESGHDHRISEKNPLLEVFDNSFDDFTVAFYNSLPNITGHIKMRIEEQMNSINTGTMDLPLIKDRLILEVDKFSLLLNMLFRQHNVTTTNPDELQNRVTEGKNMYNVTFQKVAKGISQAAWMDTILKRHTSSSTDDELKEFFNREKSYLFEFIDKLEHKKLDLSPDFASYDISDHFDYLNDTEEYRTCSWFSCTEIKKETKNINMKIIHTLYKFGILQDIKSMFHFKLHLLTEKHDIRQIETLDNDLSKFYDTENVPFDINDLFTNIFQSEDSNLKAHFSDFTTMSTEDLNKIIVVNHEALDHILNRIIEFYNSDVYTHFISQSEKSPKQELCVNIFETLVKQMKMIKADNIQVDNQVLEIYEKLRVVTNAVNVEKEHITPLFKEQIEDKNIFGESKISVPDMARGYLERINLIKSDGYTSSAGSYYAGTDSFMLELANSRKRNQETVINSGTIDTENLETFVQKYIKRKVYGPILIDFPTMTPNDIRYFQNLFTMEFFIIYLGQKYEIPRGVVKLNLRSESEQIKFLQHRILHHENITELIINENDAFSTDILTTLRTDAWRNLLDTSFYDEPDSDIRNIHITDIVSTYNTIRSRNESLPDVFSIKLPMKNLLDDRGINHKGLQYTVTGILSSLGNVRAKSQNTEQEQVTNTLVTFAKIFCTLLCLIYAFLSGNLKEVPYIIINHAIRKQYIIDLNKYYNAFRENLRYFNVATDPNIQSGVKKGLEVVGGTGFFYSAIGATTIFMSLNQAAVDFYRDENDPLRQVFLTDQKVRNTLAVALELWQNPVKNGLNDTSLAQDTTIIIMFFIIFLIIIAIKITSLRSIFPIFSTKSSTYLLTAGSHFLQQDLLFKLYRRSSHYISLQHPKDSFTMTMRFQNIVLYSYIICIFAIFRTYHIVDNIKLSLRYTDKVRNFFIKNTGHPHSLINNNNTLINKYEPRTRIITYIKYNDDEKDPFLVANQIIPQYLKLGDENWKKQKEKMDKLLKRKIKTIEKAPREASYYVTILLLGTVVFSLVTHRE